MSRASESPDLTTACPECDSAEINERKSTTPPYHCTNCGHDFDEPIQRAVRTHNGIGQKLIEASPDDLGGSA